MFLYHAMVVYFLLTRMAHRNTFSSLVATHGLRPNGLFRKHFWISSGCWFALGQHCSSKQTTKKHNSKALATASCGCSINNSYGFVATANAVLTLGGKKLNEGAQQTVLTSKSHVL